MAEQFEIISIPSVFESAPVLLDYSSERFHKCLRIKIGEDFFIVGDLALNEGNQPHKEMNSSPSDLDYQVMMSSALLVTSTKLENPLIVTTGFPYATYQVNKDAALENLVKEHVVEFDASLDYSIGIKKIVVEVKRGAILPEVSASANAIRHIQKIEGDFMVVSLGYGTFETILSNEDGEIGLQRTASSSPGIAYALDILRKDLFKLYPSTMLTDAFLDEALRNGYIFLNRKKVDIKDLRSKALNNYYENVISPTMKKAFSDREFARSSGIYLSGGGALYPELVALFKREFEGVIDVIVPNNPNHLAAKGYCLKSMQLDAEKGRAVGIDLGNSSTIICTIKE